MENDNNNFNNNNETNNPFNVQGNDFNKNYNDFNNGYNNYNNNYNTGDVPDKTASIIMIVVGFICGILWGALSLYNYTKMKAAYAIGDQFEYDKRFKNIKIFTAIGVVLNAILLMSR